LVFGFSIEIGAEAMDDDFKPFDVDMAKEPRMVARAERMARDKRITRRSHPLAELTVGVPVDTPRDRQEIDNALWAACLGAGVLHAFHVERSPIPEIGIWSRVTRTR
jgi:hypothetical protein